MGNASYLGSRSSAQLLWVHGKRKLLYFMRERLAELGPAGQAYVCSNCLGRQMLTSAMRLWRLDDERVRPTFVRRDHDRPLGGPRRLGHNREHQLVGGRFTRKAEMAQLIRILRHDRGGLLRVTRLKRFRDSSIGADRIEGGLPRHSPRAVSLFMLQNESHVQAAPLGDDCSSGPVGNRDLNLQLTESPVDCGPVVITIRPHLHSPPASATAHIRGHAGTGRKALHRCHEERCHEIPYTTRHSDLVIAHQ